MRMHPAEAAVWRAVLDPIGVVTLGASVGAVLAVAILAGVGLAVDGPGGFPYVWDAFEFAAIIGAACGAIAFPVAALGPLAAVPRRRVLGWTTGGTMVGGVLGLLVTGLNPLAGLAGVVGGFVLGACALHDLSTPAVEVTDAAADHEQAG